MAKTRSKTKTWNYKGLDKGTRPIRQGDRNTYSATDRDEHSDSEGKNDHEPAKTIGHRAL